MNNDRHQDDRVSAAYRELAGERTPAELDRKVLEMAANSARPPTYSRWMSWSRPLAWAATVTLCLAITLELVRDPVVQDTVVPNPANTAATLPHATRQDALVPQDDAVTDEEREMFVEPSAKASDERDRDSNNARRELAAERSLAEPELQEEVAESLASSGAVDKAGLARMRSSGEASPAAPAADMLRATESPGAASNAYARDADVAQPACAGKRRATPESWRDCILELEANGDHAAAQHERSELKDTFPEFKWP